MMPLLHIGTDQAARGIGAIAIAFALLIGVGLIGELFPRRPS